MITLFINHFLSDAVVKALCWTLIHSLWQGLFFSLLAAIIITLSKRSSSALRYNLFSGLFILLAITSVITFFRELAYFTGISATATSVAASSVETGFSVSGLNEESYLSRFVAYFNTHSALIVTIWFIIFCARLAKMLADIGYIQRVKHFKTQEPGEHWQQRLQQLAVSLGIGKYIVLLESGLVKVPAVAGFLKPVILVPIGLLAKLPQDQVEAILLHELAHIKRKDYFINLLQSFVETIFFFNPSALWISSLIRSERENCCDDMAVTGASRKSYVNALVSFQEYCINDNMGNMAMAFPGTQSSLLDRVKRIINNENKSLDLFGRIVLLASLVLMFVLPVVFSNRSYAQNMNRQSLPAAAVADTTGDNKGLSTEMNFPDLNRKPTDEEIYLTTVTTTDKEKNRYKLVAKGDSRPIFYINDQEIYEERMLQKYDKLIDNMLKELWKRQGEVEKKRAAERRRGSASN